MEIFISSATDFQYYVSINVFTQPLRTSKMWLKVNLSAEFYRFEFRVFLLLD